MDDGAPSSVAAEVSSPPTGDGAAGPGARARHDATWRELLQFLPDVGGLLWRLSTDGRVPWRAKAIAASALAYVLSPLDLVPFGVVDDIYVATKAVRYLVAVAGYDVVREQWHGSGDGFALLLVLAGVER